MVNAEFMGGGSPQGQTQTVQALVGMPCFSSVDACFRPWAMHSDLENAISGESHFDLQRARWKPLQKCT
eukprot:CAMPEP_0174304936 /NCGR_PEP_ID=MMETSP0809-20121228/61106_1 /TAXON_ID=73025 ORGANISM="Eutreptiella gymnastica-like, Strain CCMP1594" /NCGR_SAMPLE_ID=MMETSP0809 /ASSEMBLY_ACC=CAM_ASM_000658 /LENGTH=68 /DNA_ID=CAMNT_0015411305 /DNA_START=435 /DNA_END=641 /DNA_ORIENTATION=-